MQKIPFPQPGVYPFWFWNGVQNEILIREQLKTMKTGGCRGVVLHSREGNKIPYLSDRWFELVTYSCECAAELGLTIWLYDEHGCPSGNAGMQVQKQRPDLQQKHLVFEYAGTDPTHPSYAAYDAATYEPLDEALVPASTPALRFKMEYLPHHVDTLSRESADLFISLTHAKYEKYLSKFFGNVIEAVYTDDESYQVWNGYGLVWSEVLETEFRKHYQANLKSILPLLVEDLPGAAEARTQFYKLAQKLFLENFIVPQVAWCHQNGLAYTGHLCGNEGPTRLSVKNFGTTVPYLRLLDIPAIDEFLCDLKDHSYLRHARNCADTRILPHGPNKLFTLLPYKFASSVANQFKSGLVSVEDLTFIGWDIQTDFLNTQMLFELGMGANLMTPHAYYYTIGDGTKYDCPPSYFTQQPFYPTFGKRCTNWTRIAEYLLRGTYHADCLLLYPDRVVETLTGFDINTVFKNRKPRVQMSPDAFDEAYCNLLMQITRRHIGYEIGEDSVVAKMSEIHGNVITLGKQSYKTILVMSGIPLSPETTQLLQHFRAVGGTVITLPPGEFAALDALESDVDISGEGSEEILVSAHNNDGFRETFFINLLGKTLSPKIKFTGNFLVYDPVEEIAFLATNKMPVGFSLEHGAACMIMPRSFAAKLVAFETTVFCSKKTWAEITVSNVSLIRKNIAAFHKKKDFTFTLEEGARVTAIYTENMMTSGLTINGTVAPQTTLLPHHPCDSCFEGVAESGLCHLGENRIELAEVRDMVYLEGDFIVDNSVLKKPTAPTIGDLAAAGYPHYWGGVDYTFTFTGKHERMRFELAGAAEVEINGKSAGIIFGKPSSLRISDFCKSRENKVTIRLFNTAANFVTAEPIQFGLSKVEIA